MATEQEVGRVGDAETGSHPTGQAPSGLVATRIDPARVCECIDSEGEQWLPMYGCAPHECYWRKGPEFTLGQSTLIPFSSDDCFVPDLEPDEGWDAFVYPSACGVFYCPGCQQDEYQAAWKRLIDRIGPPPAAIADTHPKDGDVEQAPLVSGAGPQDIAQPKSGPSHD